MTARADQQTTTAIPTNTQTNIHLRMSLHIYIYICKQNIYGHRRVELVTKVHIPGHAAPLCRKVCAERNSFLRKRPGLRRMTHGCENLPVLECISGHVNATSERQELAGIDNTHLYAQSSRTVRNNPKQKNRRHRASSVITSSIGAVVAATRRLYWFLQHILGFGQKRAKTPTCRSYWFLQHIYTRSDKNTAVADVFVYFRACGGGGGKGRGAGGNWGVIFRY